MTSATANQSVCLHFYVHAKFCYVLHDHRASKGQGYCFARRLKHPGEFPLSALCCFRPVAVVIRARSRAKFLAEPPYCGEDPDEYIDEFEMAAELATKKNGILCRRTD
jgi:hypothetical protein